MMKEVTHIVRIDFGEIEIKLFCKMVPPSEDLPELQRSAMILEKALTMGKERGLVPPDEDPNYIEIHRAPEYDEE